MRRCWKWLWLFMIGCLAGHRPACAVPGFAREYGVTCQTCHSIAPRLNEFGLGFKANNYNWPGQSPAATKAGLSSLPISPVAEVGFASQRGGTGGTTAYRALGFLLGGALPTGTRRAGGYIASVVATTNEEGEKSGNLEKL